MHVVDIAPCASRSRTCSLVDLNHASQPLMTVILASTYSATESIVFLLIHSMSYCLVKFFLWTLSTSLVLCSNSSNKEDINRSCYNRLSFSHAEIPPCGEGLACLERSHSFVRDYPSMQEGILPSAQGGDKIYRTYLQTAKR